MLAYHALLGGLYVIAAVVWVVSEMIFPFQIVSLGALFFSVLIMLCVPALVWRSLVGGPIHEILVDAVYTDDVVTKTPPAIRGYWGLFFVMVLLAACVNVTGVDTLAIFDNNPPKLVPLITVAILQIVPLVYAATLLMIGVAKRRVAASSIWLMLAYYLLLIFISFHAFGFSALVIERFCVSPAEGPSAASIFLLSLAVVMVIVLPALLWRVMVIESINTMLTDALADNDDTTAAAP